MNISKDYLPDIKKHISGALQDAFSIMFSISLEPADPANPPSGKGDHAASITLLQPDQSVTLTVSCRQSVLDAIIEKIYAGQSDPVDPEMPQQIVCEIANIVGNSLKNYLNHRGTDFTMDLPKPGPAAKGPDIAGDAHLHFILEAASVLDLDFTYSQKASS